MTEDEARRLVAEVLGTERGSRLKHVSHQPHESDLAPVGPIHIFTSPTTGANYTVSASQWSIIQYRDPRALKRWKSLKRAGRVPSVSQVTLGQKKRALTKATQLVDTLTGSWRDLRLRPVFHGTDSRAFSYFFTRYFPSGASDGCHWAMVAFNPVDGIPHFATVHWVGDEPRIDTEPNIPREDAESIASDTLRKKRGALWAEPVEMPAWLVQCLGFDFTLSHDALGVQRLVYRIRVVLGINKSAPSREEYQRQVREKQRATGAKSSPLFLPPGTEETSVEVDAHDGEVLPFPVDSSEDLDRLAISPSVWLDGRRAYLYYMPVVLDGEVYVHVAYLDRTRLWPGKLDRRANGEIEIDYRDKVAKITPEGVTILGPGRARYSGRSPVIRRQGMYLHYADVVALTGDTITWDAKRDRLDINTVPGPP